MIALYVIIAVLAAIAVFYAFEFYSLKKSIITLTDDLPEKPSPKNMWLKLTNEGKKYITSDSKKIYLKVVK